MIKNTFKAYYECPIGIIEIKGINGAITALNFVDELEEFNNVPDYIENCIVQLDEYFKGIRKEFMVKIQIEGTEFRKQVWNELMNIPYGETKSYKDIAEAINNPKAVRAVGNANHNNNISIIIPCHRVIGINGSLVGYGGGLWRKKWLLEHEKNFKTLK